MDNPRFNLSDRFQRLGGIALALMFIMLSTASAWADTSPSLELKHAFGDKATVTFYGYSPTIFGEQEWRGLTKEDISKFMSQGSVQEMVDYATVVAHVEPAAGYWTNEALLFARMTAKASIVQTRGVSVDSKIKVTLIELDEGRNDGAGWYYFEMGELFDPEAYGACILDGFVLPKFDLSKATVGKDGVTCTEGQWSTTLTIDNSKTSFEYNGSKQGPSQLTNTSIIVKNGDDVAVTFATVGDHVSASVGAKEGSSLNDGKAIDVGSYALTINANATAAEETLDGANTRGSSTAPAESDIFTGIFVNSKDVDFTITPKVLTIKAEAKSKVYGEADPTLTYTKEGLLEGDAITGALARAAGEDVGEYAITQGTLSAGDNYTITFTGAKLTINAADFAEGDVTSKAYEGVYDGEAHTITVTAPKSATVEYGTKKDSYDLKEAPSYTDAGEYTVYYKVSMPNTNPVTGSQTIKISKKTLTITANAQEKVAGEKDPDLTYTSDGLVEGDAITGALARAEGEGVGEYAITQGTLSAGDNYTITFTGAKLTINAADFAEGDVTSKAYEGVYDGEAHTITVTAPKSATVEYGTKKDSYDLKEAPSYTDAGEYTVYYKVSMPNTNPVTGSQTIKISKKTLTITANAQEKVAGEKDPDLTYTSDGLVEGDAITGALARAEGEGVGEYDITQGTLTAGDNYTIAFTGAKLTIKDIKKSFKVVVAKSEGGSVSVSKIEAFPGTQINMKIIPTTGYHLETITIKKSHGGEVQHDITFDAKGESWDYFLMPSDDVIITAVFEKDKAAQNIFIYKSYYGEVVANTISADENEPVNLVAHPAYDNCVLDELVVINDEGKQLDLTTSYDSKEGNIYTFMMTGNWVQVYSTFRGINDVVDGARPFGLDNRFYQLSQKDQSILQTTAETKDVQIGLSLNANIFCQVADDGSLMMEQGEDVGLMIGGLKKGNFFRIDHDGEIALKNPDIIKEINDAFPQPAHILTRGEDTAIIKPGVAYEVVEDGNLELVLKGSAPLVLKSIIVEGPEPTAINRLQADDEAADIYDLSGRKVDPTSLRKGMYIRNGKKIIIK